MDLSLKSGLLQCKHGSRNMSCGISPWVQNANPVEPLYRQILNKHASQWSLKGTGKSRMNKPLTAVPCVHQKWSHDFLHTAPPKDMNFVMVKDTFLPEHGLIYQWTITPWSVQTNSPSDAPTCLECEQFQRKACCPEVPATEQCHVGTPCTVLLSCMISW